MCRRKHATPVKTMTLFVDFDVNTSLISHQRLLIEHINSVSNQ